MFRKLILLSLLVSPLALADAPVVSISPASPSTPAMASGDMTDAAPATPVATAPAMQLTLDQRVAMLERQISAMNQIDLVNQVSQLEQQVQDLQGQVQVLSHTLQTVQAQTTSQYADLDKRLDDASTTTPTTNSTKANSSSSSTTPTTTTTTTTTTSNSTDPAAEQALYDAAYKNIREQKNAAGLDGMKKYLQQYPDGKNAASAHYWLGQIYLLKGDDKSIKNAVTEFDAVIKKYPKSDKAREASLKLGFAYLLQSKTSEARTQFRKVMKDYPHTSEAKMAESRLAQLS